MTQSTLGALLAQHIAEEAAQTRSAQERAAGHISEKARQDYAKVAEFFDLAREQFTADILAGVPSKKLRIQVGSSGNYGSETVPTHGIIYGLISAWTQSNNMPASLTGKGTYSALWTDFTQWAAAQGLRTFWEYAHDGGGMHSWWLLRVEPAGALPRPVPQSESPTQRRQRVLSDVLEAYIEAGAALQSMRSHPRAVAHLARFGNTLTEAKALSAEQAGVAR